MQLVPQSWGSALREFNKCHSPAGSPVGGMFCSTAGSSGGPRVKYPRTFHLPWSEGVSSDDKIARVVPDALAKSMDIVVTEKMDGENTTMYRDSIHARSVDAESHSSQSWVRQFHASIAKDIPPGWRVVGENVFAKHSIAYDDLPSHFVGFSIWNERNEALGWDETFDRPVL